MAQARNVVTAGETSQLLALSFVAIERKLGASPAVATTTIVEYAESKSQITLGRMTLQLPTRSVACNRVRRLPDGHARASWIDDFFDCALILSREV